MYKQVTVISILIHIFAIFEVQINCDAARILAYFPTPSLTHMTVFRPLINELVKRRHDVTVITTTPEFPKGEAPANLTEIDIHDKSQDFGVSILFKTEPSDFYINDYHRTLKRLLDLLILGCEKHMKHEAFIRAALDKSVKYDLLLLEAWLPFPLYLTHIHKVPTILISSFGTTAHNLEEVGAPSHISRQPLNTQTRINADNIWQKICVMFTWFTTYIFQKIIVESSHKYYVDLDPTTPTWNELAKNVDMLFLNVHSAWELNRPVPPNVVYLGGLHLKQPKKLPPHLQSYMDSSEHGVIYVSFGSSINPSLLPSNVVHAVLAVLSKLPYDVIWRWTKDELPGKTPNIMISKWLPQADLLRHPKMKLFINQAGLQSTDESINAGVPMIAIPLDADQWYNAELYVYYKIGLKLDISQVNEDNLLSAVNNIMGNASYRDNVVKLRSIMRDEMQSPLERAVWWIEYVIRHGGAKHLRSPLANLTWAEYLELDVVFLLLGISLMTTLCLVVLIYLTCKYIRRHLKKKSTLKKKQK